MLFVAVRKYLKPVGHRDTDMGEFFAWLRGLYDDGTMLISGPANGRQAGVFLLLAPDRDAAEAIMAGDPFHRDGNTTFELYQWDVHQFLGGGAFSEAAIAAARH